jgi:uncharacterized protein YkwD
MGRSIATLLTMLVMFAVLAALFAAIDMAAGVPLGLPIFSSAAGTRTPTAVVTAARTPSATARATITGTVMATSTPPTPTATASPTASPTEMPTPPGGVSPPHYGTQLNYTNNTSFSPAFLGALRERIIELTNRQRAAHGLAALTESTDLDIIAASRSQDMIQRGYFGHFDPTGPLDAQGHRPAAVQELLERNNIAYAEVGENLIGDTRVPLNANTPAQVVRAWMGHPEHRANLLHPTYTTIGVGIAAENRSDGLHVVIAQVFIR